MRQPMRNQCTPRKCSHSCPHHFPTLIPNLLPHVGWAIVGSQCIQCVSLLLNEAPKVWIKLWKIAAYFTYISNINKIYIYFEKMSPVFNMFCRTFIMLLSLLSAKNRGCYCLSVRLSGILPYFMRFFGGISLASLLALNSPDA